MPEIVACPECGRKLKVPDEFLGKKVKCPQCSAMFKAEAEGGGGGREEREERLSDRIGKRMGQEEERRRRDDDDDRPSRRGRDDDDDRGRSRRGRDEDDDDRPRSRRGRDDDDDYDDRSSRSRRGRDDDDDYDDDRGSRGRGPSPKQEKAGWKSVSFALLFIIISNWIFVGYIGVNALWALIAWALAYSGAFNLVINLGYAVNVFLLVLGVSYLVTNLVGHGFTLATPGRPGWSTKPLGISSFSCLAAATACFLLYMLWVVVVFGPLAFGLFSGMGPGALVGPSRGAMSTAPLMGVVALIGALLNLAGSIVFMFYLNNVGLRVKRNDLAKNAIVCFIVVAAYVVISTLVMCLWAALIPAMVGGSRNPGEAVGGAYAMGYVGLILSAIIGLIGLALLVWYIVLLYQVRGGVDTYVRRVGK